MKYDCLDTDLGRILLVSDEQGIRLARIERRGRERRVSAEWRRDPDALAEACRQMREYLAGQRTQFDLPLAPAGTEFQKKVWSELRRIPYGETISYGELARRVGNPRGARSVGAANGRNPLPVLIPCHRVIGSNGDLVGYGGGLPMKRSLMELETRA